MTSVQIKEYKAVQPIFEELREVIKNTTFYNGSVKEAVSDTLYDEGIKMSDFQFSVILDNCSQDAFKPISPEIEAMFRD
jgi:hypothetical protein